MEQREKEEADKKLDIYRLRVNVIIIYPREMFIIFIFI